MAGNKEATALKTSTDGTHTPSEPLKDLAQSTAPVLGANAGSTTEKAHVEAATKDHTPAAPIKELAGEQSPTLKDVEHAGTAALASVGATASELIYSATGIDLGHTEPMSIEEAKAKGIDPKTGEPIEGAKGATSTATAVVPKDTTTTTSGSTSGPNPNAFTAPGQVASTPVNLVSKANTGDARGPTAAQVGGVSAVSNSTSAPAPAAAAKAVVPVSETSASHVGAPQGISTSTTTTAAPTVPEGLAPPLDLNNLHLGGGSGPVTTTTTSTAATSTPATTTARSGSAAAPAAAAAAVPEPSKTAQANTAESSKPNHDDKKASEQTKETSDKSSDDKNKSTSTDKQSTSEYRPKEVVDVFSSNDGSKSDKTSHAHDLPAQNETAKANHQKVPQPKITDLSDSTKDRTEPSAADSSGQKTGSDPRENPKAAAAAHDKEKRGGAGAAPVEPSPSRSYAKKSPDTNKPLADLPLAQTQKPLANDTAPVTPSKSATAGTSSAATATTEPAAEAATKTGTAGAVPATAGAAVTSPAPDAPADPETVPAAEGPVAPSTPQAAEKRQSTVPASSGATPATTPGSTPAKASKDEALKKRKSGFFSKVSGCEWSGVADCFGQETDLRLGFYLCSSSTLSRATRSKDFQRVIVMS